MTTLGIFSSAGCINSPDLTKISCTQDKYCPDGYVCIGAKGTQPGLCAKATDGGYIDAISALPEVAGSDGASGLETANPLDTALDLSQKPDINPNAPLDSPLTALDLGGIEAGIPPDSASDTSLSSLDSVTTEAGIPTDTPPDAPSSVVDSGLNLDVDQPARGLSNGATCSAATECSSGNCVSSKCCASSSCPSCQDCSGAGGTCAKIAGSDGQSCGTNMYCQSGACGACTPGTSCSTGNVCETGATSCSSGRSVCTKTGNKSSSTQCSSQTCSGSTQYNAAYCAAGTCPSPTTSTCSYGCNGNTCQNLKPIGTACSANSECQSGGCLFEGTCGSCGTTGLTCCAGFSCQSSSMYCDSSTTCQAKVGTGSPCTDPNQCLTGGCQAYTNVCGPCGTSGESCCAGGNCNAGLYCVNPTSASWICLACGVRGSWCCAAPAQACNAGLTCDTGTNVCG